MIKDRLAANSLTCDSQGNCMLKDNLKFSIGAGFGKAKIGMSFADNSLTCDSQGNCMIKDNLLYGSNPNTWSPTMADNSLTCDSQGNCMIKDNLKFSMGACFGKAKIGMSFDDNSLTCDSQGNCMLKDRLCSLTGPGLKVNPCF